MAAISAKRIFGELEKRTNARTANVAGWRARYVGPDTQRHLRTFGDKMAAEAWLNAERILIDRGEQTQPVGRPIGPTPGGLRGTLSGRRAG
jgi:hypothetical protein